MLYSCTHMVTVDVKGLYSNLAQKFTRCYVSSAPAFNVSFHRLSIITAGMILERVQWWYKASSAQRRDNVMV